MIVDKFSEILKRSDNENVLQGSHSFTYHQTRAILHTPLDNVQVKSQLSYDISHIVWRLRENIIRTVLC